MAINPDFEEMFSALSNADVEYLVVGAHAVMLYCEPRYTKDIDIWVRPDADNATRVLRALAQFGAPIDELTADDLSVPGTIFQIGIEPNRIDVITAIDGVEFSAAWPLRNSSNYGSVPIPVIDRTSLITNKKATGRPQDLLDLERLTAQDPPTEES